MAKQVQAKLTQLSNEYSAKVKEIRKLREDRRKASSDAEVKRINGLIDTLTAESEELFTERNRLAKVAEDAKDYVDLNKKIAQYEIQIAKRIARGEGTADLDKIKQDTLNNLAKIAPTVEKDFPELKKAEPKSTKTGPMGNVQMTTGTNVAATTASKTGAKPAPVQTPSSAQKPKPKPAPETGGAIPEGFNVGSFRMADEASMAKANGTVTGTKTATGNEDINAIYALARSKYDNVDSIFLYDPELKKILIDAVGDPATTKDDMEPDEFLRRLNASDWAIRNASTYRARDAQRREYNETLDKYNKQLEMADTQEKKDAILSKIGQLNNTSSYARGLASAKAFIEATASGLTGTMDPKRLDAFVKRMYDSANDKDANIINRELAALISYKPGSTLGGAVGADLTALRATARANGFDLDTTFKDQINTWLQRLAVGESVGTFQNVIRSQAKLGLPDKVANLLDQGLDLANIYAPYKNLMAAVLEVAPDSINLNDGTLRSAIGPEKEMSLYDFQRVLRKDPRWQYTDNARTEASDSVLKVLRDFGFQG